jgi:hypothetical protein
MIPIVGHGSSNKQQLGGSVAASCVPSFWDQMVSATDKNVIAFSRRLHSTRCARSWQAIVSAASECPELAEGPALASDFDTPSFL